VGEEFSERGPNVLSYLQHIFQEGKKYFSGGFAPPGYGPGAKS